ncbi:MAG: prepilin-type N-terminal cleavage/methylation domain-containing protein [Candidatus Brocadiia bacterium]
MSRRRPQGFSLVEMVAALVIFTVAVVAALEVLTVCLRSAGAARNRTRAALLAQSVMEEALASDLLLTGTTSGEGGAAFEEATWRRQVEQTETGGLYQVSVAVSWPAAGGERGCELVSLWAER